MNKNALSATLRLPTQAIQEPVKEELLQKEEKIPEELLQKEEEKDPLSGDSIAAASDAVVFSQESPAALPEYPTYQAGRLNQVILPDGTILKPVDGIYTATTEAAFDMLNYYSEQDTGLVSKLF